MNNKKLGTAFEREMVKILSENGYWVHFISPDNRGAQPFDIIAVKNGIALAADCKTCEDHIFRISRLEWNQRLAFQKWIDCGNVMPVIFVKYNEKIYMIDYDRLVKDEKVDLNEISGWQ